MSQSFTFDINPARIVFGREAVTVLAEELSLLGCKRPMVVTTSSRLQDAQALTSALDQKGLTFYDGAAMHTPVPVTEHALAAFDACNADSLISFGGGSSIGLSKAIAYRNDAPQIAVPTTYSGSEVTAILGQTENGLKTTVRSPSVLPEVVIYDPAYSLNLPLHVSVPSGLNAIAHGIEALYAGNRNPVSSLMAAEGIASIVNALPELVRSPTDYKARREALYGAWLCGTVLGAVDMSLHHKLCHVLGGTFNLPHAETHAVLIPHVLKYNEQAAQSELSPLVPLFGPDLGRGLWDFAKAIDAPMKLSDLGLKEGDLDKAVSIACQASYGNPRPLEPEALHAMLERALIGAPPHN